MNAKMRKKELFYRLASLKNDLTSKNINLQVNSNDINTALECFFTKYDHSYNMWVEKTIQEFLDVRKKIREK